MNNEIGRKITSLTLMTIMLASAFAASAPSVMPNAAAANANLFVSAENSQFQNYFSGPQVIEVVVIDSDIKDTDKGKGEPDVTINGNKLRMVQTTDGNWYGYFADKSQALTADSTADTRGPSVGNGTGLDFGLFCSSSTASTVFGVDFSQTVGFAVSANFTGGRNGDAVQSNGFAACTAANGGASANQDDLNNVVRENKTVNWGVSGKVGQIGLTARAAYNAWPIIQLYNFQQGGNVVVQYNKGGGVQSTTLKFDSVDDFAKLDLDRTKYPLGAQVHTTITDIALNIDPTDEDSWAFSTADTATLDPQVYYQLFDENGATAGDAATMPNTISGNLTNLMFDGNGLVTLNTNTISGGTAVVSIQDNADSVISGGTSAANANTATISAGEQPLVFTETAPNTGVFGSYDESDVSNLIISTSAPRGQAASIQYNDKTTSIVTGYGFATVDMALADAEWNSGEEIPITVTDSDANLNSRQDETMSVSNSNAPLIPSLTIGKPFTLAENGTGTLGSVTVKFAQAYTAGNAGIGANGQGLALTQATNIAGTTATVDKYSGRAIIDTDASGGKGVSADGRQDVTNILVSYGKTVADLKKVVYSTNSSTNSASGNRLHGFDYFNYDIRGLSNSTITGVNGSLAYSAAGATRLITVDANADTVSVVSMFNGSGANAGSAISGSLSNAQGIVNLNKTTGPNTRVIDRLYGLPGTSQVGVFFAFKAADLDPDQDATIVADFFSFGYINDGVAESDRINNMIVRIEAEETGDNTGVFEGTLEYVMVNQINILDSTLYDSLDTVSDSPSFIVNDDLDGKDAPRVNYNDKGADGVTTQVSDQVDAPTHSGVVSFDKPNYKIADTVTITLEDADLNTDVDLVDIYTVVTGTDLYDQVGKTGLPVLSSGDYLGRLLDVTFDDEQWKKQNQGTTCTGTVSGDDGLAATGFTLIETTSSSGIFTGDYQVPGNYCARASGTGTQTSTTGKDMEVNYVDFRDASGNTIEIGDGAGIRANTGSVSLDRTVYPVPWGNLGDATPGAATPNGKSIFPLHASAVSGNLDIPAEVLGNGTGDLTIHVQVNDPDYDVSASGEDKISEAASGLTNHGPVKVMVSRSASSVILATAGYSSATANTGKITVGTTTVDESGAYVTRELGPITETAPNSGIFEFSLKLRYTDGPSDSNLCPSTTRYTSANNSTSFYTSATARFADTSNAASGTYCILQGDIITVEYKDATDASGNVNTVTDSATFDLRNGALQSDKSVYIIGSDMILTLIEPDFDLNADQAETYDLDLIEWDSDAATCTLGDRKTIGDCTSSDSFDPEPSDFRETGDSTGIFQSVLEIPSTLGGKNLERGEEIVMEYTDWGPSGSDYVGDEDEDINLTIFTSNFGATVELDQKVYTWTDKVYITIVAPDHNMDSNLIDTIGDTNDDAVKVATRGNKLDQYHLAETGADTGIFTGEVILAGFAHDADGDGTNDGPFASNSATDSGPTNGFIRADNDDGITVSFEFSEDETVVGSSLIRWNIGEVSWLEASYPASGSGVVRVIDPDMNWNPEAVNNFNVNVWSDSDAGGIELTVTETNEATGIFEGTVNFSTTSESSGARLRVAEGDTVTAEYKDNTLPDPYTTADELDITGTSFIGTVVPPLERAPASGARVVDAFGNTLDNVSVDQQVQITADLTNGQDREQAFAYLVQIQDENGVTVSLAWITGSLSAGQSFSPALSWIPTASGTYTATVFVWESVDNPTALSPPVSVDITVS